MDWVYDTKDQNEGANGIKMPFNLSKVLVPMAIMAMTASPDLLKSQDIPSAGDTPPVTASVDTKASERTENTKALTGDPKTARMTLKYGDENEAGDYSRETQCFVLIVNNGKETGKTLEELAEIIQTHIVKNSMDVTYFLDDSWERDDATAITSAWSNGESLYKPNSDADYVFNLNELNESFEAFKKTHESKAIKTTSLNLNE